MIEIQNLTKVIGSKEVLRDLNISVGLGDFVSIIGPSGSGKTTLLNIILLIASKTSGSYCYKSEDIDDILSNNVKLKKFRNDFGVMSAFSELIPNLNVRENIILPAVINKIKDVGNNYRSLLKKLQIEDLQNECSNSYKSIKSTKEYEVSTTFIFRWVCDSCQKVVGIPNDEELKKYLM